MEIIIKHLGTSVWDAIAKMPLLETQFCGVTSKASRFWEKWLKSIVQNSLCRIWLRVGKAWDAFKMNQRAKGVRRKIIIQLCTNRIGPNDVGQDDKWYWIQSPLLIWLGLSQVTFNIFIFSLDIIEYFFSPWISQNSSLFRLGEEGI